MAGFVTYSAGGDGCAAPAVVGLAGHGQTQRKRKLSCSSSEVTAKSLKKTEDSTTSREAVASEASKACAKASTASGVKKTKKKRRTKWNMEPGLSVMRQAVYLYRNGLANSVQIQRRLDVAPRTLRRYVDDSKDPSCKQFFMRETMHERCGREVQEASERFGNYSPESFNVRRHLLSIPTPAPVAAAAVASTPLDLDEALDMPTFEDDTRMEFSLPLAGTNVNLQVMSSLDENFIPAETFQGNAVGVKHKDEPQPPKLERTISLSEECADFVDFDFTLDSLSTDADFVNAFDDLIDTPNDAQTENYGAHAAEFERHLRHLHSNQAESMIKST